MGFANPLCPEHLPKEQVITRTRPLIQKTSTRAAAVSLAENVLCKHAFISPKSLNRRLFTVQTPLQVGLLIGLQKVRAFCDSMKHGGLDSRESIRPSHFVPLAGTRNSPLYLSQPIA